VTSIRRARCPTCKEPVATEPDERPAEFPFCSARCRFVDLHRWLSGEYAVPGPPVAVEEDREAKE